MVLQQEVDHNYIVREKCKKYLGLLETSLNNLLRHF